MPGVGDLVEEEPVPELGVIAVGIEDRVGQVGLSQLGVGNRLRQPPVVRRATQSEHVKRDLGRHTARHEVSHERVEPFPGKLAWDR